MDCMRFYITLHPFSNSIIRRIRYQPSTYRDCHPYSPVQYNEEIYIDRLCNYYCTVLYCTVLYCIVLLLLG